jgi:hypothetical protein
MRTRPCSAARHGAVRPCGRRALGRVLGICRCRCRHARAPSQQRKPKGCVACAVALAQRARGYVGLGGRYHQTMAETITKQRQCSLGLVRSTILPLHSAHTSYLQQPTGMRRWATCAINTGRLRAAENARARASQAPPVRPLFCTRFRGEPWPPIAVDHPLAVVAQRARC